MWPPCLVANRARKACLFTKQHTSLHSPCRTAITVALSNFPPLMAFSPSVSLHSLLFVAPPFSSISSFHLLKFAQFRFPPNLHFFPALYYIEFHFSLSGEIFNCHAKFATILACCIMQGVDPSCRCEESIERTDCALFLLLYLIISFKHFSCYHHFH